MTTQEWDDIMGHQNPIDTHKVCAYMIWVSMVSGLVIDIIRLI